MKVFVLSALLIASFNAIQSQSVSEKVNDDINNLDIPLKISVISTRAYDGWMAISQKFTDFYLKFSVTYGFQLGNLGTPDVSNTYPKIMNDLQFLFMNSISFDNGVDYQYKLSQATYELGKNLDPVRYDGYTIQSLIEAKPTAINCWNDNVASIKSTYDSAFQDVEARVDSAVNHAKSSVDSSLTKIQAEVERVAGQSVAHGRDSVTNYLEANYPEILAKFTGFRDEIATDGHNTFADTVNSVNSTLFAASKEYQKIRTVIFDCINEA